MLTDSVCVGQINIAVGIPDGFKAAALVTATYRHWLVTQAANYASQVSRL